MKLMTIFSSVFLSLIAVCRADAENIIAWQEKARHLMNSSDSYVTLPLGVEPKDLEYLQNIKVERNAFYDRFGSLDEIENELPEFLEENVGICDSRAKSIITNTVSEVSRQVVEALGAETAWVTIRFTKPNNAFDLPRWHLDGAFYKPYDATNYKYAAVLKGPGTLFANNVTEGQMEKISERVRDKSLIEEEQVFSPSFGEGALFKTGGSENSAVHSEPPMPEDRIFFSIVPGSHLNIEERKEKSSI